MYNINSELTLYLFFKKLIWVALRHFVNWSSLYAWTAPSTLPKFTVVLQLVHHRLFSWTHQTFVLCLYLKLTQYCTRAQKLVGMECLHELFWMFCESYFDGRDCPDDRQHLSLVSLDLVGNESYVMIICNYMYILIIIF